MSNYEFAVSFRFTDNATIVLCKFAVYNCFGCIYFLACVLYCLQGEFVHCEYELQVTFYSFSNPDGLLAKRKCCDDCPGRQSWSDRNDRKDRRDVCDSLFSFCLRSIDAPVSNADPESNIYSICSNIMSTLPLTDTNSALISNSSLGIPNPVSLYGSSWVRTHYYNYNMPLLSPVGVMKIGGGLSEVYT